MSFSSPRDANKFPLSDEDNRVYVSTLIDDEKVVEHVLCLAKNEDDPVVFHYCRVTKKSSFAKLCVSRLSCASYESLLLMR